MFSKETLHDILQQTLSKAPGFETRKAVSADDLFASKTLSNRAIKSKLKNRENAKSSRATFARTSKSFGRRGKASKIFSFGFLKRLNNNNNAQQPRLVFSRCRTRKKCNKKVFVFLFLFLSHTLSLSLSPFKSHQEKTKRKKKRKRKNSLQPLLKFFLSGKKNNRLQQKAKEEGEEDGREGEKTGKAKK